MSGRPTDYKDTYPDELITKMADGLFDYEIYADWNISKDTFYRWLREYPMLKESYDIGMAKNLKWWTTSGKERYLKSDEKGFKYWIAIMNNKHGWGKDEITKSITHNTQINIKLDNIEDYTKLLNEAKEQAKELKILDVIPIEIKEEPKL